MTVVNPHGRLVWYDHMTTDVDKAIAFYTGLTGWTITPMDMGPAGTYNMWTNNGAPLGGVMKLPAEAAAAGAPPHWLMYVSVADIEKTYQQALALGASSYVPPTDIPGIGRFAVLGDPQGAVFALYVANEPQPDTFDPPKVGEVAWNELVTSDPAAAWGFYATLFGWEKRSSIDMGPDGIYQLWSRAGCPFDLGGMMKRPQQMPASAWVFYLRVPDLDAAVAYVNAHGGTIIVPPMEVPGGGRIAQGFDPQGGHFALYWTA